MYNKSVLKCRGLSHCGRLRHTDCVETCRDLQQPAATISVPTISHNERWQTSSKAMEIKFPGATNTQCCMPRYGIRIESAQSTNSVDMIRFGGPATQRRTFRLP